MNSRRLSAVAVFALAFSALLAAQGPAAQPTDAELAARPTPKLPDGRIDLNGTWDTRYFEVALPFVRPQALEGGSVCVTGCGRAGGAAAPRGGGAGAARAGGPPAAAPVRDYPKYKPEFLGKVKDLEARQVQMDNVLKCMAPGVPRIGPPAKIIQNAREVVFLYDDVSGPFFRIVPTDGRPHRKDLPSSYLGDAIGRWEGDTLVVETVNFNEETWLTDDGAFHTKDLKVIERLRRVGDTIQYQATAHDPAVLVEPWAIRPRTLRLSTQELEEPARCEDRSLAQMQDNSSHDNPR